jgi:RNA polymerase sigma-70 factor (ECF subfamily)
MTTVHANDKPTIEEVWFEFESSLRAYVGRRIADPHRADDVVSEVFLRVHKNLHTVKDEERVAKWLFTIARNAVTDEYRRAGRRNEDLVDAATLDVVDQRSQNWRHVSGRCSSFSRTTIAGQSSWSTCRAVRRQTLLARREYPSPG